MREWTQISWRNAVGKIAFDDELGFVRINELVTYSVGRQDINSYYEEDSNGQKKRLGVDITNVSNVKALFAKTIYMATTDYYGRATNFVPIRVETIDSVISYRCIQNQNNGYGRSDIQHAFSIDKKDKDRLDYLRYVWICDEIQNEQVALAKSNLKKPLLKDLKIGDCLFCDKGKCKITKFYPQPNENSLMFQAELDYEDCNKQPFDVSFNDNVYVLPYEEQPISETERFNESKNEIWLSPYAQQEHTWEFGSSGFGHGYSKIYCVNVYWNKIPDAAEYIISLYKKFDRPYLQSVYHIKDYTVDRNEGFLSIENLIGDEYIITVKAEDRQGKEIALSRGIKLSGDKQCLSQYFKDE